MKKKKGFTIVELLAVVAILGILTALGTMSVIKILKNNEETLAGKMETDLKDAAIAYIQSNKITLKKCSTSFKPEDPSTYENGCYRILKISEIIDTGHFTDSQNHCNREETIVVYKLNHGEYADLSAYAKEGICK